MASHLPIMWKFSDLKSKEGGVHKNIRNIKFKIPNNSCCLTKNAIFYFYFMQLPI